MGLPPLPPLRRKSRSSFTNPVGEPAVEKGFVGRAALGEAQEAFALQRLERAQQDGLTAWPAAFGEEGIEGGKRLSADATVGNEISIVFAIAIQRRLRALQDRRGDLLAHVHAGGEQLRGDAG